MTDTAERAAKPEGTGYRFLKLRMQGTKKDLKWFRRVLERSRKVKLLDISEPFANKGTNKYYIRKSATLRVICLRRCLMRL